MIDVVFTLLIVVILTCAALLLCVGTWYIIGEAIYNHRKRRW